MKHKLFFLFLSLILLIPIIFAVVQHDSPTSVWKPDRSGWLVTKIKVGYAFALFQVLLIWYTIISLIYLILRIDENDKDKKDTRQVHR